MERSLFRYIIRHTWRDQILLLVVTAVSFPLIYINLEIPKRIVNNAIGGKNIPQTFLGFEVTQISYLMALSLLLLTLITVNGGIKYWLNVYRGVVGERTMRRMRHELYEKVLRFPLPQFKTMSGGEIIPMIVAETEPIGSFIGDSINLPVFQGGLLLTYLAFIFNQNPWLGLAAVALYPPQIYLIPRLQRKINALSKERVQTARALSDRIGESVAGSAEIRGNDTYHLETADISNRLGTIFGIRVDIYKRKFFVKFLNNFLAQVTPFFFYSVGGYFVIKGEPVARRAGRGAGRVQGHPRSVERAAAMVFDEGGRADQVRADRLAVRAAGIDRRQAARRAGGKNSEARRRDRHERARLLRGRRDQPRRPHLVHHSRGPARCAGRRRPQRQGRHRAPGRAARVPERRPDRRRQGWLSATCTRRFPGGGSPTRRRTPTSSPERLRTTSSTASSINR